MNQIAPDFKSGFVAIIGKPNTGKSTLMNRLLGEKLSITSAKPQTTRYAVKGIWNTDKHQIIFIDTPGFLIPRYEMQERMARIISDSYKDVDLVIFLTQVQGFPTDYDLQVLDLLKNVKSPVLAVFNKTDLELDIDRESLKSNLPNTVDKCLFVSALTGDGIEELIDNIRFYVPFHAPFYDEDQLSDLPLRFFAKELIREAIFHQFEEEIPYATAVLIERFQELPAKVVVDAVIWIERSSQKPILIGKGGQNLKKIREYAEVQLSEFLQFPAEIHLFVKVNENWRKKPHSLKELGFK
ncbi:MAG: GTPase Era [Candidatus Cloacimonetes bacterium]|jgi:GTP-binding protein Era|nr:GTPase Era [Candidatus Cloacimonadota bacterium]MDD2507242.1 GTPase Era [Candidatus Cloacimonadota bacterium]MDD4147691.1 GTPase Era [Candidatus Cloacimonadota bacterium]MDD4560662.1 GTPase Era [Candidatus Cloacimonadota bacterium]